MLRSRTADGPGAPRRFRLLRSPRDTVVQTDSERIAAVAAEADVPVEDVLREVHDFRLALETDMIIAAAAVDAEAPELLSDVLDGERRELATFHDRLMERLADAAAEDEITLRRARREQRPRVSRLAATAAAIATFVGAGLLQQHSGDSLRTRNAAALETAEGQYRDFSSAITSNSPGRVQVTARQLHETLEQLISQHANDPEVARRTALLLQAEISLLQTTDPAGASQVLAQARTLVNLLKKSASKAVRESVAPVLNAPASTPKPKPKSSPSPSPSPTSTASPKASQSADPDNPLHTP